MVYRGFGISVLQWGAYRMRQAEIEASRRNPLNSGGPSGGWIGDEGSPFKLAGARSVSGMSSQQEVYDAWLGGRQNGSGTFRLGSLFGGSYSPNSAIDNLFESFAGPHDWLLRNYAVADGSVRSMGFWGVTALNVQSAVTLVPAAGFVGAQVAPALAFTSSGR